MESVLESGVRLTFTTAAVAGASAETDCEESPERPQPTAPATQIAIAPTEAAVPRSFKKDFLLMPTVTYFQAWIGELNRAHKRRDTRNESTRHKFVSRNQLL